MKAPNGRRNRDPPCYRPCVADWLCLRIRIRAEPEAGPALRARRPHSLPWERLGSGRARARRARRWGEGRRSTTFFSSEGGFELSPVERLDAWPITFGRAANPQVARLMPRMRRDTKGWVGGARSDPEPQHALLYVGVPSPVGSVIGLDSPTIAWHRRSRGIPPRRSAPATPEIPPRTTKQLPTQQLPRSRQ